MDSDPYGRHAVSRRGAPVSGASSLQTTSTTSPPQNRPSKPVSPTSAAATAAAKKKSNKKSEDGIEMRPLLSATRSGVGSDLTGGASGATTSAAALPHKGSNLDSWFGAMLKLKAKQAKEHTYNLRANFKSKKGFHVQVPKKMLFYTVLVFLVLPLFLFLYKENHIHDHDPAYLVNKANGTTAGHNHSHFYNLGQVHPSVANHTRIGNHHLRGHTNNKHHQSLQQLLGGSRNATRTSISQDEAPKLKPPAGTDMDSTKKLQDSSETVLSQDTIDGGAATEGQLSGQSGAALRTSSKDSAAKMRSKRNQTDLGLQKQPLDEVAFGDAINRPPQPLFNAQGLNRVEENAMNGEQPIPMQQQEQPGIQQRKEDGLLMSPDHDKYVPGAGGNEAFDSIPERDTVKVQSLSQSNEAEESVDRAMHDEERARKQR